MLLSLIRILTPSILLRFVFLALGDADWRRPLRLTSLRDEWRRIGLLQPACCCSKNFRRKAKGERRKTAGLGPGAKAPRCQASGTGTLAAGTTMAVSMVSARIKKHGWCAPIRRHSSRSDVSRLGRTTRASEHRQTQKRMSENSNDKNVKPPTTAARPTSAHTAH